MILPTKQLHPENSLIYLGGNVLELLDEPKTISRIWEEFKQKRTARSGSKAGNIPYDWFILAVDFLYAIEAVELSQGRVYRKQR